MSSPPLLQLFRDAFRRNLRAGIVLQCFAGLILLLYFAVPAADPVFAAVQEAKLHYGRWFPFFSTALFGGMIPLAVLWSRGGVPAGFLGKQILFMFFFWGIQGVIVDEFYRLQGEWFGHGRDPVTLFKKLLIDQGPYNLLWATPSTILCYTWKDQGFSFPAARNALAEENVFFRYLAIQMSSWSIWIPAVFMIYCLPLDLQVPMQNLVLCFFSLLLAFVSRLKG